MDGLARFLLVLGALAVAISLLSSSSVDAAEAAKPDLPLIYDTTTYIPEGECGQHYKKCEKCVSNPSCLFCNSDLKCKPWPSGYILPPPSLCALGDARWSVCWLNFKALIIAAAVVAGVLIISLSCCIYCCCCRPASKRRRAKYQQDEEKWEREREERRMKADERKAERLEKANEIRAKYGISSQPSYERFDKK